MENHGKTMVNHGKTMENHGKTMENHGKTMENHGNSFQNSFQNAEHPPSPSMIRPEPGPRRVRIRHGRLGDMDGFMMSYESQKLHLSCIIYVIYM